MTAEALRALAVETRDAAQRRARDAFHEKWGRFRKCASCGARQKENWPYVWCWRCETGRVVDSGYSKP